MDCEGLDTSQDLHIPSHLTHREMDRGTDSFVVVVVVVVVVYVCVMEDQVT